jgi:NADH:ubiquinone oxidoreductase subunit 5 (subunit L)/multisubunit Na+/H+ antiporter MnhA subunit
MEKALQIFILIPLFGFFISLLIPRKKENFISGVAILASSFHLISILLLTFYWFLQGTPTLDIKHFVFIKTEDIEIFIDFYFDKTTWVFALVGSLLAFLVILFSRSYLHREQGFKRFFNVLFIFLIGYNLVIFSGNFETLFVGWELVGIASFLLIGFYRDRYLPVKNSLKVISIYRLGDIFLILVMWMSHHLWHENITFSTLNNKALVDAHLIEHNYYGIFIGLMILGAAAIKSAQFPFSSWLPRAMEGPTSSSAIFYGSLSVHLGVFLLLRTYPYWESLLIVKLLVILTGLLTAIIAMLIARVQSSVKTQIAYSSAAQIGLIFIELALGLHTLALIHFAANAMLRTYQLLVSPSVLSYFIHDMFFSYNPKLETSTSSGLTKLKNSLYLLSVKEWNLDAFLYRFLWHPFKYIGDNLNFLNSRITIAFLAFSYALGIFLKFYHENIPLSYYELLPFYYSCVGLLLILKSFGERGDAIHAWTFAIAGQFFITLSIALLNQKFGYDLILIYLSGSVTSAIAGYICLRKIRLIDHDISLNRYHGYSYEQPMIGFIFLVSCLGIIGLPFTPTFIGIDLLFSHIHKHEEILIIFTAFSFIFVELAILRIYARVFLGQHKKAYHPIAFKSS